MDGGGEQDQTAYRDTDLYDSHGQLGELEEPQLEREDPDVQRVLWVERYVC
jgi:hypothetical protein